MQRLVCALEMFKSACVLWWGSFVVEKGPGELSLQTS